jgi:serine/threonine protein kinase
VGADGVARIMDFGIARAETRITSTMGAQVKGKVPYMSPEQLEAKPVDRRSDVYAAGIVTWELLAGERLFRAENDGVLFNVVLRGAQQPPSQLNRDVPAPIDAICMRALSLSPDDRFPTAAAFAEALEDAVAASQLAIATPRAVAAFLQELSLAAPRGAEAPPSSGVTPSAPFGPSSLDPSSVSSASRSISGEAQPTSGMDADSAVAPKAGAKGARGSFLTALAAAITASLITGVAVWILARDQGAPLPPATGASPALSAAISAAVETSLPAASTEAPAPSGAASAAHASSSPGEPPKLGRPKPPATKGPAPAKHPPPKATSTAFRPEEP